MTVVMMSTSGNPAAPKNLFFLNPTNFAQAMPPKFQTYGLPRY